MTTSNLVLQTRLLRGRTVVPYSEDCISLRGLDPYNHPFYPVYSNMPAILPSITPLIAAFSSLVTLRELFPEGFFGRMFLVGYFGGRDLRKSE